MAHTYRRMTAEDEEVIIRNYDFLNGAIRDIVLLLEDRFSYFTIRKHIQKLIKEGRLVRPSDEVLNAKREERHREAVKRFHLKHPHYMTQYFKRNTDKAEKAAAERKERYHSDPEYRRKMLLASSKSYHKRKAGKTAACMPVT